MVIKLKLNRPIRCLCGRILGEKQGEYFVYQSPLICGECSLDNSDILIHLQYSLLKLDNQNDP